MVEQNQVLHCLRKSFWLLTLLSESETLSLPVFVGEVARRWRTFLLIRTSSITSCTSVLFIRTAGLVGVALVGVLTAITFEASILHEQTYMGVSQNVDNWRILCS